MTYQPRPLQRSEGASAGLYVGSPVSASTSWSEFANTANWTRGKGAALVPFTIIDYTIPSGTTRTFRFRTKTRNAAIERVWYFALARPSSTTNPTATIKAPASSGTAVTVYPPFSEQATPGFVYVETVASKATTETEITCDIAATTADVYVWGIACYEQDRAGLADDTTDFGVMADTIRSGQPILAAENQSVYGVQRALANLDARRVGIYHFAMPTEAPITRTSATPLSVLHIGQPVQVQKLNLTATTGTLYWSVYAKVAAGAGGTVAIATSGSSVSDSVSVTGTSYAWTTARAVSVHCDDFDEADGRQAAGWDLLTWTIAGDGTNALSVASLSMWFADAS